MGKLIQVKEKHVKMVFMKFIKVQVKVQHVLQCQHQQRVWTREWKELKHLVVWKKVRTKENLIKSKSKKNKIKKKKKKKKKKKRSEKLKSWKESKIKTESQIK